MPLLFSFAAKSLQAFVMEGDRLKTMVGATELIDKLCRADFLQRLLEAARVDGRILQGAAGAGRILIDDAADAKRLARVWPVFCSRWAPGLEVVQALEEVDDGNVPRAIRRCEEQMRRQRAFLPAGLPLASPVMERCRRTGRAAAGVDEDKVPVDRGLLRKQRMSEWMKSELTPLQKCFGFDRPEQVPVDFDEISGSEKAYLAVIHADGNGLGSMFMKLAELAELAEGTGDPEGVEKLFAKLSKHVVEDGTKAAVARAEKEIGMRTTRRRDSQNRWFEVEIRPLQPVVLAGDDLTLVCRADQAWAFLRSFLTEFGREMTRRLAELKSDASLPEPLRNCLPDGLSAGGSIAYISGHYPFSLAYGLAESLASRAKAEAKNAAREAGRKMPPASVVIHRVTGAWAPTEIEALEDGVLRGDDCLLGGTTWFFDEGFAPSIRQLEELWRAISILPGGAIRKLLAKLGTESAAVGPAVARMLEVAGDRNAQPFLDTIEDLGLDEDLIARIQRTKRSPLADAWTLRVISGKLEDPKGKQAVTMP